MNLYPKEMLQVAGCFCEWKGRVLLLLRAPHTVEGLSRCLPGGKVEVGESTLKAAIRETYEEVGFGWIGSGSGR